MINKRFAILLTVLLLLFSIGASFAEQAVVYDVTDYISSLSDLDLTPHKGKAIILFFYTAENSESRAVLPVWKKISDAFDSDTLEMILVHAWEDEGQPENDALIQQFELDGMHIFEDEDCRLCHSLGITAYPNTLFLDSNGTPASGYAGQMSYTTISEFLMKLGAQPLPASSEGGR